jgi:polysaccharide pyruvyl transferase WcaK-like protein
VRLPWNGRLRLAANVASASAVIIGGGGLLNDRIDAFYRPYSRVAMLCARTRGRVIVTSVGVYTQNETRPFVTALNRLVRTARHFTVRDIESADVTERLTGWRPTVVPDLAFSLPVQSRPDSKPTYIGVSVRPWWHIPPVGAVDPARYDEFLRRLAVGLVAARDRMAPGARFLLIPFQTSTIDDDRPVLARLAELLDCCEVARVSDVGGAIRAIGRCRAIVGMRLHSLILATLLGIPTVALDYDPKVAGLMSTLKRTDFVASIEEVDSGLLQVQVERALTEKGSAEHAACVEEMRATAQSEVQAVDKACR